MATLATHEFLNHLKSLYPLRNTLRGTEAVIRNPWYILAAVAFGSSNRPEAVPVVFQHALADLKKAQAEQEPSAEAARKEQLYLARRMREAVFKGGLLCGYSRV
jgi:endoribonuclease Dicer